MELQVVILAFCMLLTGTLNTIATKFQDLVVVGTKPDGSAMYFQHPATQSAMMFLGEFLCILPYLVNYWARRHLEPKEQAGGIAERRRKAHSLKAFFAFSIPAICDACGTTLLNVGLFYTYASAYQMLRGTLVFFAGIMTILILKRRLHIHNWLGMVLIVAGAALVGIASLVPSDIPYPDDPDYDDNSLIGSLRWLKQGYGDGAEGASAPLLGDLLVVLAQVAAASQFIIEEKFLTQYRVPALLAVGLEGFWGVLICAVAMPLLSTIKVKGKPIDSLPLAIQEIRLYPVLLYSTLLSIVSIAFFNAFGVKVTKRLSGAARAAIDACRTLFIWMFCVYRGWEPTDPPIRLALQILGFFVLVCGTSLYNELLRTCLPGPRSRPTPSQLQEPLLAEGNRPVGATSYITARPRSIKDNMYSMARSIRMLPQALSPHSLSSVRFSRMNTGAFSNDMGSHSESGVGGLASYSYSASPTSSILPRNDVEAQEDDALSMTDPTTPTHLTAQPQRKS